MRKKCEVIGMSTLFSLAYILLINAIIILITKEGKNSAICRV